jgi:DNA-binding MarR family transcriptional regulator
MTSSIRGDRTPLSILFSFIRTWQIIDRYLELELSKQESNPIRFAIMNALYRHGGQMTPTEISKWVFRSKNSITSVINNLEREGFVRREPSKSDRRSVTVVITEKGWSKTNKITPIAQEISREILSCLDREQLDTLGTILRAIRKDALTKISISKTE